MGRAPGKEGTMATRMGTTAGTHGHLFGLVLLVAVLALVAAACGDGGSGSGTAARPAGETTTTESTEEDQVTLEEPVPDSSMPVIEVAAGRFEFDTGRIVAPAGEAFQILFRNQGDQIHNVAIYETISGVPVFAHPLFRGELFQGPETRIYEVPALEPGKYLFYCDAHSSEGMKGTFIVK